jgi:hypothetical protein
MSSEQSDRESIAKRGIAIYREKYLSDFDPKWRGRFAAIDVDTQEAYVADFPEEALSKARRAAPKGRFYLIRIGSRGAFRSARLVYNADSGLV